MVMGDPPTPIPTHLYPQAVQLRLYQAFIFSTPILFSIILFLLFYLFYLKRRASSLAPSSSSSSSSSSSAPTILPVTSNHQSSYLPSACLLDVKIEIKDKLPVVLFSEELGTKDSLCCVCLGEFEIKEELLQVPTCKHIFHLDCIHLWLHTNSTCPLCRSSISPSPPKVAGQPNDAVSSDDDPTVRQQYSNSHQTTPNN